MPLLRRTALLALPLLVSACALKTIDITEEGFLKGRKSEAVSDRIARVNLELSLPELPGQNLHGWRLQHPSPKATLIYFYGGGESLWSNSRHLHDLAQTLEVDVVAFDVRGSGASGGQSRFETMRLDALRIYDQQHRPGLPTLVMGYSLGSTSAIHLAANRPVQGLTVLAGLSSFDDARGHFDKMVPWYAKPFVKLKFSPAFTQRPQPVDEIARVQVPTVILHGEADQTLPVVCGDRLAATSPASWKRYLRLPNQGHGNLPVTRGETLAVLQAWLRQVRSGT
jgi:pimeloyl-ACP methyl ester carboxylesterase